MKKRLLIALLLAPGAAFGAHPFLLNSQADWTTLRTSSTTHPYSDMVAAATTYLAGDQGVNWPNCAGCGFGTGSDAIRQQTQNIFIDVIGANTLMYVVNTNNISSATYKNRIIGMMDQWPNMQNDQPVSDGYNLSVPMNGAFVAMTIAFDEIYNDLTATQISSYTAMGNRWVAYSRTIPSSWELSNDGAYATWTIFVGTDTAQIALDTACYHVDLLGNDIVYPPAVCNQRQNYRDLSSEVSLSQLNVDGISGSGSSYAWERIGGRAHEKLGKWGGKYILDHTGKDPTIKPALANFYEWLFTGMTTPWNAKVPFGDTANNQSTGDDFFQNLSTLYGTTIFLLANAHVSAGQYSSRAQEWANRAVSVSTIPVIYPSDFINYVTASSDTAKTQPVVSKVVTHGGAAFWDEDQTVNALMGVLDNYHITKSDHFHTADWNGLFLAGYGENLLSNVGVGASTSDGILGFSHYWHRCDAHSGNVLIFGNQNMANDTTGAADNICNSYHLWNPLNPYVGNGDNTPLYGGDGVTESLLGNYFDYAVGIATSPYVFYDTNTGVLTNIQGENRRNFMFVHPADGANGYWIVGDEATKSTYSYVNALWHPYGTSFSTTTSTTEYQWPISPRATDNTTKLAVFLATPPNAVTVGASPFSAAPTSFVGSYINAQYTVDTSSNARVLTVLYPSNPSHAKATMARLSPSGATGASISNGSGIIDYVLISSPSADVTQTGATYRGNLAFFRSRNGAIGPYFVKNGTKFDDGAATRSGFSSTSPVSIYVRDQAGGIVSPGTSVTFYAPSIRSVTLDGSDLSGTSGSNSFTATVPAGTHTLAFLSGQSSIATGGAGIKGVVTFK